MHILTTKQQQQIDTEKAIIQENENASTEPFPP